MSEEKNLLKEKHDTLKRFLSEEHALVHLSPKVDGVKLPDHLLVNQTVTLKLSHYFRGTLVQKKDRVEAELLFGAEYINCIVPYDAIWGMTNIKGQFLMWPESAPEEVLELLAQQAKASGRIRDEDPEDESDSTPAPAARTEPVESEAAEPALQVAPTEPSDEQNSFEKKRPHLRRIK